VKPFTTRSTPLGPDPCVPKPGSTSLDELCFAITHSADRAVARAMVSRFAIARGFDRHRAAELALVASELVSNVLKYAGEGELIVSNYPRGPFVGVVVASQDRGPGPPSENALFCDGFSRGAPRVPDQTIATGRGTGGGTIRRLSDHVEILARAGGGTIIRCHKQISRGC